MKQQSLLLLPAFALALAATPASALSEHQQGTISQYCASIKQALRVIQREDSRNRITIGAIYETLSSRYITPLNLRLVSNNLGAPELVSFQTDFANTRKQFSSKFIEYSRSFEQLLASDCTANPAAFYNQLVATRTLRAQVQSLTESLGSTAQSIATHVRSLEGEFK